MFTCSICGKNVDSYKTLHINFPPSFYRREICNECEPIIRQKLRDFINVLQEEEND